MITEIPTNGAQGEPATSDSTNLQEFETGVESSVAPQIAEVVQMAASVIQRIMSKGSDKSVFGQWFLTDSRRYNADRCMSHLATAMMQLDGNRGSPDAKGEDAVDHLERALVRAAFLLFKTKKGKIE